MAGSGVHRNVRVFLKDADRSLDSLTFRGVDNPAPDVSALDEVEGHGDCSVKLIRLYNRVLTGLDALNLDPGVGLRVLGTLLEEFSFSLIRECRHIGGMKV